MSAHVQHWCATAAAALGAIAGAAAWFAMDQTLQAIYNRQTPRVQGVERDAREAVPALEVLADRISSAAGLVLQARSDSRQAKCFSG